MSDIKALAALADPTRRGLFERIVEAPRSVGELVKFAAISQPAVSQHLKVLRAAGLVQFEQRGAQRIHHPRPAGLTELRRWLDRVSGSGPKANA